MGIRNFLLTCILLTFTISSYGKGKQISILQMNIWQEGTIVQGGFDAIADEVVRLKPDIVLFSEVRNYEGKQFIPRILQAISERGEQYYGESSKLDVGILSKYKITEQRPNYPLDNDAGSVLKATIQIENNTVVVYSAHLDYTHYACYLPRGYSGVTWKKLDAPVLDNDAVQKANKESLRDEAIEGVIADAMQEKAKGNLVFLGGDFNEPSHLDWAENTKNLYDHQGTVIRWDCSVMLYENGFKDSFREVYPNPVTHPGFTFPSDNVGVGTDKLSWAPDADERDRIDFIYFIPDKRLKLISSSVVGPSKSIIRGQRAEEEGKDTFILPASTWPTDHKAVLSTFRLK